jgi:hypothetical protein
MLSRLDDDDDDYRGGGGGGHSDGDDDDDDAFLKHHVFSDKATFHVSCEVNRHNC